MTPPSGILSLVQMSRLRLFGNYYLGTGLISVVGTSFATLSTANAVCWRVSHLNYRYDVIPSRYSTLCTMMGHARPLRLLTERSREIPARMHMAWYLVSNTKGGIRRTNADDNISRARCFLQRFLCFICHFASNLSSIRRIFGRGSW